MPARTKRGTQESFTALIRQVVAPISRNTYWISYGKIREAKRLVNKGKLWGHFCSLSVRARAGCQVPDYKVSLPPSPMTSRPPRMKAKMSSSSSTQGSPLVFQHLVTVGQGFPFNVTPGIGSILAKYCTVSLYEDFTVK